MAYFRQTNALYSHLKKVLKKMRPGWEVKGRRKSEIKHI
jgi:hypothetical protein